MKRRTLMILENAKKRKNMDEDETKKKQQETQFNSENISPNASFIENTPDRENHEEPYRLNLFEANRRSISSPINIVAEESETECNYSFLPQVRVRSSSVSSSSSRSSSSSSSSSSSGTSGSCADIQNNNENTMAPSTTNEETLPCNRLAKTIVTSYRVSPINELESDPDLSDDDPTFEVNKSNTFRSFSFLNSVDSPATDELPLHSSINSSANQEPQHLAQQEHQISGSGFSYDFQSSADPEPQPSGSGVNESNAANRRPKKRPRNPEKWKQNIAKSLRNTGKSYISQSKSKKELPARSMKEPCTCPMKCPEKVDETCRKEIFNSFWQLGSIELQRMFIKSCMMEIQPKYKYTNAKKPRAPNNAFFFNIDGIKTRVCKKYFINTLDITDRQIRTVKAKSNNTGFLDAEQRGKHKNRKTTDEKDIQDIEAHINSIPRIPSHLTRANSKREYITGGKTIKTHTQKHRRQIQARKHEKQKEEDAWC